MFGIVWPWLAACLGLGASGAIVAAVALPGLGRFALAFGPPVAFFIVGLVALWVGHVSIVAGLIAGLVVLAVVVLVAYRRFDTKLRAGWPVLAVFVVAFLFVLGLRALDPAVDPASGEKFLDFGLVRAHLRASALPAEDFWFANEPLRYYYGGQYVVALVARLTDTSARYAYNLGLATFYAMLVTAAYGLAGAIGRRYDAGRWSALFGAFFVGVASNFVTVRRQIAWLLPREVVVAAAGIVPASPDELARPLWEFHYWGASRVVRRMISEFPLFAYINGDLHAHMLAAPFELVAVAVLATYFWTPAGERWYRRALLLAVAALGGFLGTINIWSVPTLLGLTFLTLYFAPADPVSVFPRPAADALRGHVPDRIRRGIGTAVLVGTVGAGVVAGAAPVLAVLPSSGVGIGLLPTRSHVVSLLLIHGPFLVVLGPYLAVRLRGTAAGRAFSHRWTIVAVGVMAVVAGFLDALGVALFAGLVLTAWYVLEIRGGEKATNDGHATGYEGVLALAAFGLVLLVELVYAKEPAIPGRANTFFKTYAQVWKLFAVATAVVVGRMLAARPAVAVPDLPNVPGLPTLPDRSVRAPRVAVAVLVVSTSLYGVGVVGEWTTANDPVRATDEPTLDALEFAHDRYPHRMEAIGWLDERSGTPTIVTAPGKTIDEGYYWVNAPSSLTAIPTVVGWEHASDYHGNETYWQRVRDVRTIFAGPPAKRDRLLEEYDVTYVYHGPNERKRYGHSQFSNATGLAPVFENEAVTIYRVRESQSAPTASGR